MWFLLTLTRAKELPACPSASACTHRLLLRDVNDHAPADPPPPLLPWDGARMLPDSRRQRKGNAERITGRACPLYCLSIMDEQQSP